ncbi:MFS transporter [Caballeronia sordidicola]|uniref:Putative metabolite transport protein n=1 Tax=Caballeronia sordidicola TaxID=196367 RepID=A0A226WUH2_CABSO|nr:MFS transporter [Caballeronia sordidicola]OXC74427.1 putative metabolite transport protein [Caballeronia sordidicola]
MHTAKLEPTRIDGTPVVVMSPSRRVLFASAIGTAIEWYDFFLYGLIAPLVFDSLFFPRLSPAAGTIAVFATFAVGFAARLLGGLVFGHFGDRIGRKSTMLCTLVLMGLSTMLIGLLPTYQSIGLAAPVALGVLRFLQGLGLGGESTAACLMTVESCGKRRGLFASVIQAAGPCGIVCASLSALLITRLPEADLMTWGWRIPFVASAILIGMGLYIRLRIEESHAFVVSAAKQRAARVPLVEALTSFKKPIAIVLFVGMAEAAFFYITGIFSLSYATKTLGLPRGMVTQSVLIANVIAMFAMPFFGSLSDHIGRRRMLMIGLAAAAGYMFVFFPLLQRRDMLSVTVAIVLGSGLIHPMMFGPIGSFFPEMFPTRVRFSAMSIGRQVGSVIGGGLAPLIASVLLGWSGGAPVVIGVYFAVLAVMGLLALAACRDTNDTDIAQ